MRHRTSPRPPGAKVAAAAARLLALCAVAMLLTTADAAAITLGFDEPRFTGGAVVVDDFQSDGVRFHRGPGGKAGHVPTITTTTSAHSPPNVLTISDCAGTGEFPGCGADLWGTFSTPRPRLSFVAVGAGLDFATYNASGEKVYAGSASEGPVAVDPDAGCAAGATGCRSDPRRDIAYFHLSSPTAAQSSGVWSIDDFTFDVPATPAIPGFGLMLRGTGAPIAIRAGDTVTATIAVGRHGGSRGPIDFAVTGAFAGVDVALPKPAVHDSAADGTIAVKLTGKGAAYGPGEIKITGSPRAATAGAGPQTVTIPVVLTVPPSQQRTFDLQAEGILITQSVQSETTSDRSQPRYAGVPLVAGKQTVVRFYARVDGEPEHPNVDALLSGSRNGKPLPGSPLPAYAPKTVRTVNQISDTAANEPNIFTFELPPEWVEPGEITLSARVITPGGGGLNNIPFATSPIVPCQLPQCVTNDTFTQSGIRFAPTLAYSIAPVPLHYVRWDKNYGSGSSEITLHRPAPTDEALAYLRTLTPVSEANFFWNPDALVVDISDFANVDQLFPARFDTIEEEQKAESARAAELVDVCGKEAKLSALPRNPSCPDMLIAGYSAADVADGGDYKNDRVLGMMDNWEAANRARGNPARAVYVVLGLNDGAARGVMHFTGDNGINLLREQGSLGGSSTHKVVVKKAVAIAGTNRPLTSVAHEIFHAYGFGHAGNKCPGTTPDDDQAGNPWPPDDTGIADGIGHDLTRFGTPAAPYQVIDAFEPPRGSPFVYDLMSYCGNEGNAWLAELSWRAAWDFHVPYLERQAFGPSPQAAGVRRANAAPGAGPAAAPVVVGGAQGGPALRVAALLTPSGLGVITSVMRVDSSGPAAPPGTFSLVALDAAGAAIARAPMTAGGHGDSRSVSLVGYLPPDLKPERLQVVRDDKPLGPALARSPHAPAVRVTSPRARQTVGARPKTTISWQATDADRDRLQARVDYSRDGGRTWRVLHMGPSRGRVKVDSRSLGAARRARLRIVVSDGFNETIARSAAFRSLGRPPLVRILQPRRTTTVRADQPLALRGMAFGDDARRLPASRLRWYLGRRLIARGSETQILGLAPGRRILRLEARDGRRRVGRASVTVRVRAVAPTVISFRAPQSVRRSARRVPIRIAVSLPGTLTVTGQGVRRARAAVGRRPRRVVLRIKPGSTRLVVRLTINAGGRKIRRAYVAERIT